MFNRNLFIILIFFISIVICSWYIINWKVDAILKQNKVIVLSQIKSEVNNQLKLKNQPLINLTNKNDRRILLTKEQLNLINQNIAVNTSKVDEAINTSKAEISQDLDRISLWNTILIAAIGFLGIFIPILLNIYSSRDLETRLRTTEETLTTTTELLNQTTTLANNTLGISNSASSAASSALTAAEEASLKTRDLEVLMYLLDILSKLKMLDFLRFNNANTTRESYLNSYFLKLNNSFKKCKGSKISPVTNIIFKECCIDFVITLYQLEIYATPNRLLLTNITELIKVVNDLINTDNDNLNNAYDNVIGILENIATTMPATEVLETS